MQPQQQFCKGFPGSTGADYDYPSIHSTVWWFLGGRVARPRSSLGDDGFALNLYISYHLSRLHATALTQVVPTGASIQEVLLFPRVR